MIGLHDVKHQPAAVNLLERAIRADRMPHAFAFCGPDGVGKRLMARRLAAILLCKRPVGVPPGLHQRGPQKRPTEAAPAELGMFADAGPVAPGAPEPPPTGPIHACGACAACQYGEQTPHPDLRIVGRHLRQHSRESRVRDSRGVEISIDVIREFLLEPCSETAVAGGAKVFIIEQAERLSISAQNALLKTLEEPPPCTYIVLLSTGTARLMATTLSRCQVIPFRPLPEEFIVERLHALADVPESAARFLARFSGGSLGQSLRMHRAGVPAFKQAWLGELLALSSARDPGLGNVLKHLDEGGRQIAEDMLRAEASEGGSDANADADHGTAELQREGARLSFALLSFALRDGLWMSRAAGSDRLIHTDQPELGSLAAGRWDARALLGAIGSVQRFEAMLASNVNVPLAAEVLLNELLSAAAPARPARTG